MYTSKSLFRHVQILLQAIVQIHSSTRSQTSSSSSSTPYPRSILATGRDSRPDRGEQSERVRCIDEARSARRDVAECVALDASIVKACFVCVHVRRSTAPLSLFLSPRVLLDPRLARRAHGESERIPWPPRPRPTNTLSPGRWFSREREICENVAESGAKPIRGRVSVWLLVVLVIVGRKFSGIRCVPAAALCSIEVQDGFPIYAKTT